MNKLFDVEAVNRPDEKHVKHKVYAVRTNENKLRYPDSEAEFLMYRNCKWVWMPCEYCKPAIKEKKEKELHTTEEVPKLTEEEKNQHQLIIKDLGYEWRFVYGSLLQEFRCRNLKKTKRPLSQ